eukprot:9469121-Pyramimonas_sp.AAC.1
MQTRGNLADLVEKRRLDDRFTKRMSILEQRSADFALEKKLKEEQEQREQAAQRLAEENYTKAMNMKAYKARTSQHRMKCISDTSMLVRKMMPATTDIAV